ncbi:LacI family DNA-binding transcriptional regulator [Catenulispora pinisilvae]|uniref:LacI family DNA-binding transcriptional regulator n=1 Tax=Catenulispora pinisilvae TaxID=2705253 RepID=UPI001890F134|nr:LacI family DNA-binding transcriptional regulator [Catenulispora pinisilvae]
MPITIADVAARAGVSKTTVSRVLNGKGELDASTVERVRHVIDELGYVPSARAVSLARGRTGVIGMLVPSLTWPWIGEVIQGAVDVVESGEFGVMLFTCNQGDQSMRRFASQVNAKAFDGLLVIEPDGTLDYITELHTNGLPVVLIDDRESRPGFASVATTNRAGGRQVAHHLLEIGRRHPVVVTGNPGFGCVTERLEGFTDVFEQAGIPLPAEAVLEGDFSIESGHAAVAGALARGVEFDSVFAHNDLSAAGALQALREAGIAVPGDVAVVGFDDVEFTALTEPPLTTVRQPLRELGATAARMLTAHLGGEALPTEPVVIPTDFVIRGSTAPKS